MSLDVSVRLGILPHMRVLVEIGQDDDVDDGIRTAIERHTGGRFVDPDDVTAAADVALMWWRNGDGELADYLVDVHEVLRDRGLLWVLTPRAGLPGHVDPADMVADAGDAGLAVDRVVAVTEYWTGTLFTAR